MEKRYERFIQLLKEELVPAMGCTEPIAVAFAAAYARGVMGKEPERVEVSVSGNILKNVKSVVVPNTGGLRGINASVAAGIVAGDAEKKLLVIADISPECHRKIEEFIDTVPVKILPLSTQKTLDILIRLFNGEESCSVRVSDAHANVVEVIHNGRTIYAKDNRDDGNEDRARCEMSLACILEFAQKTPLDPVRDILDRQIRCNSAIAEEGLRGGYGAQVGKLIAESGNGIYAELMAYPAAGSDARMNGCELPVVIVAGSGNQGMTASLPVIRYARYLGSDQEELYRALLISNLVALYQKEGIGKLSAFCGAVSAGCGAAAGIAYLETKDPKIIEQTICNTLAIAPGMICDGAKSSCAAKISISVQAGLMGYTMARRGCSIPRFDGILGGDADETINRVSRVAREGMASTDHVIIDLMCGL